MKRVQTIVALATLTAMTGAGCAPPLWTEMLGQSITLFTSKVKGGNDKVWVTNPADSECDGGCQTGGCGGGVPSTTKKGGLLGGLFGGGGSSAGTSGHDRLAFEVFSNYLTQKKKMKVVEKHRHNYANELGAETRRKIEIIAGEGNNKISTVSCEDLCVLDEAKKRKADKVLVYHIIDMSGQELTIHFRLSDVGTGLVEASQTIKVKDMRAFDFSYGGGRSSRTAEE